MIAVVEKNAQPPCIVRWVGRRGLKVQIFTYCGDVAEAGQGVSQVADGTTLCARCRDALAKR